MMEIIIASLFGSIRFSLFWRLTACLPKSREIVVGLFDLFPWSICEQCNGLMVQGRNVADVRSIYYGSIFFSCIYHGFSCNFVSLLGYVS